MIDDVSDFRILVDGREVSQIASPRRPVWIIINKSLFVGRLREMAEAEGARLVYAAPRPEGGMRVDARGPYSRVGEEGQIIVYRAIARAPEWPSYTALIDFRVSETGLYWVFPAGDGRINAGAGFLKGPQDVRALRDATRRYLEASLSRFEVVDEKAAPLSPLRSPLLYDRGALYVGEAAGLVNALSGEGIRQAVESALHLAEATHSCGLHPQCSRRRYRTYARRLVFEAQISKTILRAVLRAPPRKSAAALESLPEGFWRRFLEGKLISGVARAAIQPASAVRAASLLLHLLGGGPRRKNGETTLRRASGQL
ncbi:MAG: NAD(P)/FAD-dependent oxidoreductase [Desulfurococcales archaeon]|nr:NAD(P)/FAD-dependent oxidoreductase [Desulfurococcales archaeon]